ncbi:hypothetical protein K4H28_13510 [Deefgea tanakiae]|uniref:Uncharacterized protein n=1 Tax=Deefgea tanakiae TaxID=2865840 RepID=A0ABX8Z3Y0_9NEIS|nr:hypothetical protein [Deefgea tanakiae]QZA77289.1 hypothetical protein K4H28_13510 [Deefgea tanakiae]
MTQDTKKPATMPKQTTSKDPKQTSIEACADEVRGQEVVDLITSPELQATITFAKMNKIGAFCKEDEFNLYDHFDVLLKRSSAIISGDLKLAEITLAAQMQTLDSLFNLMTQRALNNIGQHNLDTTERYMRMALKAQSQCRATIETLAEVKNPRVAVFANQANISNGAQQVNNGTQTPAHAHGAMQPEKNMTNELLEYDDGKRLDSRTKSKTGRANQNVETMGKINGCTNRGRKIGQ